MNIDIFRQSWHILPLKHLTYSGEFMPANVWLKKEK